MTGTNHDLVLSGGRVVDPETRTDTVANVGITAGRITAVDPGPITGRVILDVSGQVVCPGFIDLHSHAQGVADHRLQALNGVTAALELEAGAYPVSLSYGQAAAEGRPIHYGFSASWALVRMALLAGVPDRGSVHTFMGHVGEDAWQRVASAREISRIVDTLAGELAAGGIGVGVLVGYAADAGTDEYLAVAKAAAVAGVPTFTHARDLTEVNPNTPIDGAAEIVKAAAETGAHMHYCHVASIYARHVDRVLDLVAKVQVEGSRVTAEAYPYGSGMTGIGARFLAPERLAERSLAPQSIQYLQTGRQVKDEAELRELRRRDPGGWCFIHSLRDDVPSEFAYVERALSRPGTIVATDAIPLHWRGESPDPGAWPIAPDAVTHPRTAGTYARTLRLVRERQLMSLPEAIARSTLLPAQVLEDSTPAMRTKGRLQVGCDADIAVFDPDTVTDRATYAETTLPATGFRYVLVDGTFVVRDGAIVVDAMPGRPILGRCS